MGTFLDNIHNGQLTSDIGRVGWQDYIDSQLFIRNSEFESVTLKNQPSRFCSYPSTIMNDPDTNDASRDVRSLRTIRRHKPKRLSEQGRSVFTRCSSRRNLVRMAQFWYFKSSAANRRKREVIADGQQKFASAIRFA